MFLEAGGANRTPDKLRRPRPHRLLAACDRALRRTVAHLKPALVIGVGRFAARRAAAALDGLPVRVGGITHPSPANPRANRGWEAVVAGELTALGVEL